MRPQVLVNECEHLQNAICKDIGTKTKLKNSAIFVVSKFT